MPQFARFELRRMLGAGGMGEVYEAWDRKRELIVALKTLPDLDPDKLLALKREFRSVAAISHENLITLYELTLEDGQWCLSMEYVEGTDWLTWVRPGDTCAVERLRATLPQLARGIRALHRAGTLHRDLKPTNVLVTPEGDVRILDFGLAAPLAVAAYEAHGDGDSSGTLAYMSPEHATPGALTEASDWYALGVMLYEALTGRLPFSGSPLQVMADRLRRDAEPVRALAAEAPDDLAQLCDRLLRRDVEARATGRDVLDTVSADHDDAPVIPRRRLFVGRAAELAVLRELFAARGARIASVHGRSGMGKSSLIAHFLEEISARAIVLTSRCYEQESVPFKAFDGVLDALARYLSALEPERAAEILPDDVSMAAHIFPVLERVDAVRDAPWIDAAKLDPQEVRRRAFGAIRALLRRVAESQPLVIYIDDLQWGDLDSIALLREIVRAPDAPSFLLIGAWREGLEGKSGFLRALRGELLASSGVTIHDVPVGPLSDRDAKALATSVLPENARDSARIEAALRESGGSPYLLRELIAGAGELTNGSSVSLDDVLRARVSRLAPDARRLLEVVALAGRPIHERDAFDAAEVPLTSRKVLAVLRSGNLLQVAEDELESYHDRVRETVVESLDDATRRHHHARLADALRRSSASSDAETLAGHFEASQQLTEAAHQYSIAAERAATALAFRRAADLYERALALSDAQGVERSRMTARLADALANGGRTAEAARAYQAAAALATGNESFTLTRKAAFQFVAGGHGDEGRSALASLLAAKGMPMPSSWTLIPKTVLAEVQYYRRRMRYTPRRESAVPREALDRVDFMFDAVRCLMHLESPIAVYYISRGIVAALDAGEPHRIGRAAALKIQAQLGYKPTYSERYARLLTDTLAEIRRRDDSPYLKAMAEWTEGYPRFFRGEYAGFVENMREADRLTVEECTGATWEHVISATYVGIGLAHLGRISELNEMLQPALREARELENRMLTLSLAAHAWPFNELGLDRPDSALEIIHDLHRAWPQYTLQRAATVFLKTWTLLYAGRAHEAWQGVNAEWGPLRRYGYLQIHQVWQWVRFARAEAALALSLERPRDRALVRSAERDAASLASDIVFAGSPALAGMIRAGVALRLGRPEIAKTELEQAIATTESLGLAAIGGAARRMYGTVLGGDIGAEVVRQAEASMRDVGIVSPERMTRAFANGC